MVVVVVVVEVVALGGGGGGEGRWVGCLDPTAGEKNRQKNLP